MKAHISNNQRVWIKAPSGNVYICPVRDVSDPSALSEDELKRWCLDDSDRPDNY